jgi:hypothetical protein
MDERPPQSPRPEEIIGLARDVGRVVEEIVQMVAKRYLTHLLDEPVGFAVPAVWGARQEGGLTQAQAECFSLLNPAIRQALTILNLPGINTAQSFALDYLFRSLFISKLLHAAEVARGMLQGRLTADPARPGLADLETVGSA